MKKSQLSLMEKRTLSVMLVTTLAAGLVGFNATAKKAEEIPVFKKQVGGVFDGMPLFAVSPSILMISSILILIIRVLKGQLFMPPGQGIIKPCSAD
jgi:hypothetical protein